MDCEYAKWRLGMVFYVALKKKGLGPKYVVSALNGMIIMMTGRRNINIIYSWTMVLDDLCLQWKVTIAVSTLGNVPRIAEFASYHHQYHHQDHHHPMLNLYTTTIF